MAKRPHQEPQSLSSRSTIAIMAIGGLLVAGLIVWALTRTVEPATASSSTVSSIPAASDVPSVTPPPAGTVTSPVTGTIPAAPAPSANDGVTRISVAELRDLHSRGAVTVIDVRDDTSFFEAHIPGSLHIPMARVEVEAPNIPKDKPIVTYCT